MTISHPEFRAYNFDTESVFNEFIVSIGGKLVQDIGRVGKSPGFSNADYYFEQEKVILELKCLQNDFLSGGKGREKVFKAFEKSSNSDQNIENKSKQLYLDPHKLGDNLKRAHEEPVRRVIKKANTQLKETEEYFNVSAMKIVIVNNDGLLSISPDNLCSMLKDFITNQFSHTDAYIHFSLNYLAKDIFGKSYHYWDYDTRSNDNRILLFLDWMGQEWEKFLKDLITNSPDFCNDSDFLGKQMVDSNLDLYQIWSENTKIIISCSSEWCIVPEDYEKDVLAYCFPKETYNYKPRLDQPYILFRILHCKNKSLKEYQNYDSELELLMNKAEEKLFIHENAIIYQKTLIFENDFFKESRIHLANGDIVSIVFHSPLNSFEKYQEEVLNIAKIVIELNKEYVQKVS